MEFELLADPAEFSARTRALLVDDARNNLMLAILDVLVADSTRYEDFHLLLVHDGDESAACGLMTVPPENLILADPTSDAALTMLVEGAVSADFAVPRVIGARPTVDRFVELWTEFTGESAKLNMAQGVYALSEVIPARQVPGRPRVAGSTDLELAFEWICAFTDEALPDDPRDDAHLRQAMAGMLRGEGGAGLWLWEVDGVAVSMSSHSGPAGSGTRIRAVYTPPQLRGNGYASALVAAQSEALLDEGYERCFLFTDLANPTSNKIYEAIGYQQVAESAVFEFQGHGK